MPSSEDVRYTRVFEDFETFRDKEVVYTAIMASIHYFEKNDPSNHILGRLGTALGVRLTELRDYHAETIKKSL